MAEYDVDTEALGHCPQDPSKCQVIETPTHFVCETRQENERIQAEFKEAKRKAREAGTPKPEKPDKPHHEGIILPRTVCKREITRDEAQVYLKTGKTELLTDFTSRLGRPFNATLVLKETGRHGFEFLPRKGRGSQASGEDTKKSVTSARKATKKKTSSKATKKKASRKGAAKKSQ